MKVPVDAEMAPIIYRSRCHRVPLYVTWVTSKYIRTQMFCEWLCCACGALMASLDDYYTIEFGCDEWSELLDIMSP